MTREQLRCAWDVIVVIGASAALFAHAAYFNHTCDDAYISYRYASHLAQGHGLVFNIGERVMGFSNLLWVLCLAAFDAGGVSLFAAGRLLGLLCGVGTLATVYFHLRRRHPSRLPAVAALSLIVSSGHTALWIFGGLEGPLVGLLLTGAVVTAPREEALTLGMAMGLGGLLGLLTLTRPDGLLYLGPLLVWLGARRLATGRAIAVVIAVPALCWIGTLLLGLGYYGELLPNTYYAKWHPLSLELVGRGLRWTLAWVSHTHGIPVLIVGAWALITNRRSWLPLLILVTFGAYFLRIGGDGLIYHRMWAWMTPMFALLFADVVATLARRSAPLAGLATVGVCVLLGSASADRDALEGLRRDERFLADATALGHTLAALPGPPTIAANNIGALAFAGNVHVLDMLGLTDRTIAQAKTKTIGVPGHESHDGLYVLSREPDIIILRMPVAYPQPRAPLPAAAGGYPSDEDLLARPQFLQAYQFANLALSDGRFSPVYVRKDRRKSLGL